MHAFVVILSRSKGLWRKKRLGTPRASSFAKQRLVEKEETCNASCVILREAKDPEKVKRLLFVILSAAKDPGESRLARSCRHPFAKQRLVEKEETCNASCVILREAKDPEKVKRLLFVILSAAKDPGESRGLQAPES